MAQLNITLNQDEILELLSNDRNEAFKKLLQASLNNVLKAESQEQLHATPYERSEERTDSRNGFRSRELTTRIGKIQLNVPRHRNQPFKTMVFDNYKRSEAALVAGMAEMVVNGVSTRKVTRVVETICGESISKSAVSDLCKELEQEVHEFRNRPLTGKYPFLTVDATYFKVRENHRSISKALMIAYATNDDGRREIVGFSSYPKESKESWTDFLRGLKKRGLTDVQMITSDAHEGIIYAIRKEYPNVAWQRCQFHFIRNIVDRAPKREQIGLKQELNEMFNCETIEMARRRCNEIIDDYREVAEKAMNCLEEGFESSMTVMVLPKRIRCFYRTSNHIERINKELKRRSKVIGIFPNETSLIRLMGSVLIELNTHNLSSRRMFKGDLLETMSTGETSNKLIQIAREQEAFLAA